MDRPPETAVHPRRSLLKALWVSLVGLWTSSRLPATTVPEAPKESEKPEFKLFVGRLCLDKEFRSEFFRPGATLPEGKEPNDAQKAALLSDLNSFLKDKNLRVRDDTKEALEKIVVAKRFSPNPIELACANVESAIANATGVLPPSREVCKRFPC